MPVHAVHSIHRANRENKTRRRIRSITGQHLRRQTLPQAMAIMEDIAAKSRLSSWRYSWSVILGSRLGANAPAIRKVSNRS